MRDHSFMTAWQGWPVCQRDVAGMRWREMASSHLYPTRTPVCQELDLMSDTTKGCKLG